MFTIIDILMFEIIFNFNKNKNIGNNLNIVGNNNLEDIVFTSMHYVSLNIFVYFYTIIFTKNIKLFVNFC